ncbi:RNA polymerase sigma factor [Nonomuraea basaltis]|uniref:RNA polymerase sigma factor n=1 Tax=Nonomuraea basaltis TaxID=2495887 RepID=UPI00110C55D3|nr:sigma-70 family RNA polymerase sigma factor [Nonomuraea basaltis]TMR91215.1 sigma-70 family RNA polymerase sigma factor [Nonomuraea basaltis]
MLAGPCSTEPLEERFRRCEQGAFTEIFDRHSGAMFATALAMLGNRELAADTVQETFIKVWQAAATFDVTRELQPWLFTITRRTAVDVFRRSRRAADLVDLDLVADTMPASGPPTMERAWLTWQVKQAMRLLPAFEREVLHLAYYEELTQSEIGRELGIPVGTVKSRTYRAQRNLAGLLRHVVDSPAEKAAR